MSIWIGKFDVLPTDGKSCVVTDGEHIGYIIFNDGGPRFYGDFDSADITHYMYPELDIERRTEMKNTPPGIIWQIRNYGLRHVVGCFAHRFLYNK